MIGGSTVRRILILAAALVLCGIPRSHAGGAFDFKVDRFELSRAGSPVVLDEFDSDSGVWTSIYGTTAVLDGFLHLASPGRPIVNGFGVLPGTTLNISAVSLDQALAPGDGSFTARSFWAPEELVFGDFNHMSLFGIQGDVLDTRITEVVGIALSNPTPPGQPVQYQINQHLVRLGPGGVAAQFDNAMLDPASITGEVVLALAFDGATRTVQTAISVDGGATFQTPFSPQPYFAEVREARLMLGADPLADAPRAVGPLCTGGSTMGNGSVVVRKRKAGGLVIRGTIPRIADGAPILQWPEDGLQLRIVDQTSGVPLLDLTGANAIPCEACDPSSAAFGRHDCARGDGWRYRDQTAIYRNRSGALAPDCVPGSAQGLSRMTLRPSRKSYRFEAVVSSAAAESLGAVTATLVPGTSPVLSQAGLCSTLEARCTRRGAVTRCR